MQSLTSDPRLRFGLVGLLAFTLLVRGGVLWTMRDNLQEDPDAYREIAENLLRHGEFALGKQQPGEATEKPVPTAYRPPLYPVVLSNLPAADSQEVSLVKVAALHLLLGVATVWLTWLTARRLLASGRRKPPDITASPDGEDHRGAHAPRSPDWLAPLVAGLIVACDPILLNQQTLVMTETLAAFLAILSLWCLARFDASRAWFNAALAGGAIGLAVLCRPTFLPWLGLVAIVMLVVRGRNSEFRIQNSELAKASSVRRRWLTDFGWRVANLSGLAIAAVAVLSPWAIRNYRVFGMPIVTTTHGGYTFYLANNKDFYNWLNTSVLDMPWNSRRFDFLFRVAVFAESDRFLESIPKEVVEDVIAYRVALDDIAEDRSGFVRACLYRLRQLWSPLPYKLTADESTGRMLLRYATAVWYCGVYALAVVGIWRLRSKLLRPPWIWGLLLCLAFTAVHTFYWTNLRMRAPLIPFIAIVAGAAVSSNSKSQAPSIKSQTNTKD